MKFVRSIPAFIAIVCLTIMLLAIFLGNVPTKEHKRSNINSDFCVVPSNIENYQSDLEKQKESVRLSASIRNPEDWPGDASPEQLCSYLDQNVTLYKKMDSE